MCLEASALLWVCDQVSCVLCPCTLLWVCDQVSCVLCPCTLLAGNTCKLIDRSDLRALRSNPSKSGFFSPQFTISNYIP